MFSLTWVIYVTPPSPKPGDCHGKYWGKNMIEHCAYKPRVNMDNAQACTGLYSAQIYSGNGKDSWGPIPLWGVLTAKIVAEGRGIVNFSNVATYKLSVLL